MFFRNSRSRLSGLLSQHYNENIQSEKPSDIQDEIFKLTTNSMQLLFEGDNGLTENIPGVSNDDRFWNRLILSSIMSIRE